MKIYAKIHDLNVTEAEGGLFVFSAELNRIVYLNATAAAVLEFCDGKRDSSEIARDIAKLSGVEEVPLSDVEGCLEKLLEERLIVPIEVPTLRHILSRAVRMIVK